MRLIDADALIPLIQEDKIEGKTLDIIKALGDGLQAETLNQACDRHIKIISSLPTIDAVPVVWTPISERQPDVYGQYLVTAVWQGELVTDFDDYFVYGWDDYGDTVVAWMPVPKPYDGERNDDEHSD